jgi:AcrR family transcriptional regulator
MTGSTTRAKQQRSVETREALLLAAGKVFSRQPYAEARLKDISEEASISQGSLYFHFGNKEDIASAVLEGQQELMTEVLARVLNSPASGLAKILELSDGLAALISSDPIVQGGVMLSTQLRTGLEDLAHEPYFEWVRIASSLIRQGIEDGSIHPEHDVVNAAEFVNQIFVGVQVLSGLADSWASMPNRMKAAMPHIVTVLINPPHGS